MEPLLEAIRAATVPDATDDIKAAGASACRTLLAALEAKSGEPLAQPASAPVATPVEAVISAIRGMQPEQLLDLAIARLKAALPAEVTHEPVKHLAVPLVPLPKMGRRP